MLLTETPPVVPRTATTLLPRRCDAVLSCDVGNELLLYDGRSNTAVSLNLTAAAIWDLCDGSNSVADIIGEIADAIGEQPSIRAAEIERVLHELNTIGLIVLDTPEAVTRS